MNGADFLSSPAATSPPETVISAFLLTHSFVKQSSYKIPDFFQNYDQFTYKMTDHRVMLS